MLALIHLNRIFFMVCSITCRQRLNPLLPLIGHDRYPAGRQRSQRRVRKRYRTTRETEPSVKLLGQPVHFRDNLLYSFRRYTIWWIILLITMAFDFLSTAGFVWRYGTGAEANMVTRLMMEQFSPNLGNFVGKALQLLSVICFVGLSRKVGNFFILFIILINCWAIVINSMG